jgi:hypothetical protein
MRIINNEQISSATSQSTPYACGVVLASGCRAPFTGGFLIVCHKRLRKKFVVLLIVQ